MIAIAESRHVHDVRSKVAALRDPATYPDAVDHVEVIETHYSCVFLAGDRVYKMKKPVRAAEQDFSTLGRRRFNCREEVRLNRRLAPDVYLGVVPLVETDEGELRLAAAGVAVEWLVAMRRLPADAMLDRRIAAGTASEADMQRVAHRLAVFHRRQERTVRSAEEYELRLWRRLNVGAELLQRAGWPLPAHRIHVIVRGLRIWLAANTLRLGARVARGNVVEAHGDLRPEHVSLGDSLAIIDALEFSKDLRVQDTADEIGFLALECERLGAPALGAALQAHYRAASGDTPPPDLVHFYQALRALGRAGLAIVHLEDERHRRDPEWPRRARRYLALAAHHLRAALPRTARAGPSP